VAFRYPPARRDDLIDILHGVPVPDPYRWLEDAESADTQAWVEAENALTRSVLDGPERDGLVTELTSLFNYPRTTSLLRRGGRYFLTDNPGLLNQPVLYLVCKRLRRLRLAGAPKTPARLSSQDDDQVRVLLDPNELSPDGTTALTAIAPSPDGRLLAYALSEGGSDRQMIRVRDVETSVDREDVLRHVKFASIAWTRDASGFYYLRFPEDSQYFGRIHFHRLGDPQAADAMVFETPDRKEVVPMVHAAADGRWVVITAQRGASDDSEIYLIDRGILGPLDEARGSPPRALFTGFDAAYDFIESARGPSTGLRAGRLFFRTTRGAPRGRIVSIDPDDPGAGMLEVVPESAHRLSSAVMAKDTLVATSLENASDRLLLFALDGSAQGEIPLPGIGSILSIDAEPDDDEVRFVFTSFTQPPTAYLFRLTASAKATAVKKAEATRSEGEAEAAGSAQEVVRPLIASRSFRLQAEENYQTTQVWYPSKDGTRVSMFLVHRQDLARDGARPVLLSGYGGFNISRTPAYDPGNFPFLDRGGVFALANLRGGGEYGEDWHRAGMLDRKQNVFDDFIAAAEFLIADGYTSAGRIAIEGGSNGGLLVGAAMIRRPDLFGAVLCRVPVADMLRYHLFTVGRFWIPEYGSADDPSQFGYLLKYSPYHNVRPGVRYPPTLVMTADTDDRVAPGMAKKFAARLQAAGRGGPFLIRVETRAGHGAGKPLSKVIEEEADMLAFLYRMAAPNSFAVR
jgi:prolyl oligopeptidase